MSRDEIEARAVAALRVALRDAPAFGSVGLTLHFHNGQLDRLESSRAESYKAEGARHA